MLFSLFKSVPSISFEELQQLKKQKQTLTVVDVRDRDEFIRGHYPGSINVPLDSISSRKFDKTKPIYLICQSGARSKIAVSLLEKKGYQAFNLKRGYLACSGPLERGRK